MEFAPSPANSQSDNASGIEVKLLQLLCGDHRSGYVKVSARPPSTNYPIAQPFPTGSLSTVAGFIAEFPNGTPFYFNRATCLGGKANCFDVLLACCAVFNTPPGEDRTTRDNLEQFAIQPNAIIRADGRLYALWLLDPPVQLEGPESRARAEHVQRCLAEALGGDSAANRLDLEIPLPGTDGVECELFGDRPRCCIDDFDDLFALQGENEEPSPPAQSSANGKPQQQLEAQSLQVHPIAEAFPPMQGAEFARLVQSIRINGQRQPITLASDGRTIVDGLNRWRACLEAGVPPKFETLDSTYDEQRIIEYIVDSNLNRRDLSLDARAFIMAEVIAPALEQAAKERQRQAGKIFGRGKLVVAPPQAMSKRAATAREQAAKQVKVSENRAAKAQRILQHAPELKAKVLSREMSMNRADKEARKRAAAHNPQADQPKMTFLRVGNAVSPLAAWLWDPTSDDQLEAPANTQRPEGAYFTRRRGRVLIGPTDLYARGVSDESITKIHATCRANRQWDYLLQTQFPERIAARKDLPPSAWIGVRIEGQEDVAPAEEAFRQITNHLRWLSITPREELVFSDLTLCDLILVTALAEAPKANEKGEAFTPFFAWLADLYTQAKEAGCAVVFAPHLEMVLPQEEPKRQGQREQAWRPGALTDLTAGDANE